MLLDSKNYQRISEWTSGLRGGPELPRIWKNLVSWVLTQKAESAFHNFWQDMVERALFAESSSMARKALGLQLFV